MMLEVRDIQLFSNILKVTLESEDIFFMYQQKSMIFFNPKSHESIHNNPI